MQQESEQVRGGSENKLGLSNEAASATPNRALDGALQRLAERAKTSQVHSGLNTKHSSYSTKHSSW